MPIIRRYGANYVDFAARLWYYLSGYERRVRTIQGQSGFRVCRADCAASRRTVAPVVGMGSVFILRAARAVHARRVYSRGGIVRSPRDPRIAVFAVQAVRDIFSVLLYRHVYARRARSRLRYTYRNLRRFRSSSGCAARWSAAVFRRTLLAWLCLPCCRRSER